MKKSINAACVLSSAAFLLLGTASAQQDAATPAQPAAAAKPAHTPTTKGSPGAALSTPKDKTSYALGMNLAENLKAQSVEIDPNILLKGMKDVLSGGKTLLTTDEEHATLLELQSGLRKAQMEKMAKAGEKNKKEGEAFLAANKSKPGVVTLPSGLQYKILQTGTGAKPAAADSVSCNYKGTLIDGTEFDSSYKRGEPTTFPVSGVIKGWTEALQLMPVGSKWQLFVPAALAYGDRAASALIGPSATLIFEVELVSIQDKNASKTPDKAPDKTPDKK
jgi:FKBP-type peptidyl-prolyl cis-trans isomerase FklB